MNTVKVGNRTIGHGHPCFIAAEIGINHNGDMGLAHRMIDAAADAGVDAVKFQNYRTEDFLSDRSLTYEYQSQGKRVVESQWDMFKRCELPLEHLTQLKQHCDDRGIIFFSTPTGKDGVSDLLRVGSGLIKNGSDYLTHLPLIREMARTGIPAILSTGMATLAEVDDAVRTYREAGGKDLILLHCTSSYPTPPDDVNLRKIPALAAAFGCPVGMSDHTEGITAAVGAVALGACFIEKHFTLDRNLLGPDHSFSSDPCEMSELVKAVRCLETNLGTSTFGPAQSEKKWRNESRVSCVAAHDMPAGYRIEEQDIAFRRPSTGLEPKYIFALIGMKLVHSVATGAPLNFKDILLA